MPLDKMKAMDDQFPETCHPDTEFANFPWERLDEGWFQMTGGWSIQGTRHGQECKGRMGLSICTNLPNGGHHEDLWILPRPLQELIERARARGREEARRRIRLALGGD